MRAILCPFAFVLGGALAVGLVVALFTLGQTPSFPYLVLSAAGAGLVSWLGLGIGVVLRKRRSGAMPSNAKLLLITVLVLLIYVVLGAAFVLIATPIFTSNYAQGVDRLLLIASIASVPLLFGISLGYNDWPNAALGSIIGLWQGALVGVAFGLGAAIVIWITYVPPCAHPSLHCINFPPLFDAGFIFIISLFVGFGLGLADAGAAAVGLLLCPFPRENLPEISS